MKKVKVDRSFYEDKIFTSKVSKSDRARNKNKKKV